MPHKSTPSKKVSPKQKPRRVSGRPLADEAVGRQAILDSTIRLLKTRTPEQLSVLEVAGAAGVTRTLVRYYFSDLSGLLREVTELLMRQLQDRMEVVMRLQGTVYERVHQRLLLRLEFMREHPHFERLALSEIYYGENADDKDPADTPLQRITRRGLELTSMLLADSPASTIDPRFLHLAILSVSAFIPIAQPLLATLFGEGPDADRQVDDYLRFISHVLADKIQQADEVNS
ncbi:TetR/AcrR family transcriptional regulator [Paraburkholderia antibiotica]|uniref:TetR/AcrR family transcriptional regulator n=1 Tax=Paraburkholderia antibiotica TaxID=2728839 RepID=A0A7X9X7M3_9BURK|nr:TetR/AcrR family transcriptional regulator [Paraburkholderia antibiotica]NML32951.1 TetR/AcrR family transcriptional regulator [Paraburkholderia antibiotica]